MTLSAHDNLSGRRLATAALASAVAALAGLGACAAPEGAAGPDAAGLADEADAASATLTGLTPFPIVNDNSGKALEIGGGQTTNGALANQWAFLNNTSSFPWQFWGFRQVGTTNQFEIVNYNSGKCLEIGGGSTSDGALANQWDCVGAANQRWLIQQVAAGSNRHRVVNVNSGKCLEIGGGSTSDGALANQWGCVGAANQIWRITVPPPPGPGGPTCKPNGAFSTSDCSDCCSKSCSLFGQCL